MKKNSAWRCFLRMRAHSARMLRFLVQGAAERALDVFIICLWQAIKIPPETNHISGGRGLIGLALHIGELSLELGHQLT